MRVLLVTKFYYLSGGAERYVFDVEDMLREAGHEVAIFSMYDPRNRASAHAKHFISPVRFRTDLPLAQKVRAAAHAIWSREARWKLRNLLAEIGRPDIVHLHSYLFQLTPSILAPLVRTGAPIVHTCHDYAQVCVNQHLYNHRTGRICEACLRHGRLAPLWTRCIKGSFAASAVGCAAGLVDHYLARTHRRVRRFMCFSEFIRGKLIEGGLPAERVARLPLFTRALARSEPDTAGDAMVYFGRLVPQKGIGTFLDAARLAPEIPCRVLGNGPLGKEVQSRIARDALKNVELLGHREGDDLWHALASARAVLIPSEWYEPFGLVILEAMAAGRPVIASDIAGPAEIVSDGKTGLLFAPGDAEALARCMRRLWADPTEARQLGAAGRAEVSAQYTPEAHFNLLMREYEKALS